MAPASFKGVWSGVDPKLYLPLQFLPALAGKDILNAPDSFTSCNVIARLRPDVSLAQANAEIAVSQKRLLAGFIPQEYQRLPAFRGAGLAAESARTGMPTFFGRTYSAPLYLMQGLVAVVLLLCCVNVGGLMMAKIHERQREFAVRTAIGAARWRLVRQHLTESLLIACGGAALGAAAAWYSAPLLLPFFRDPNMFRGMSVQPDSAVLLYTGAFALLTTLLSGLLPAWRAGAADPGQLLKARTASAATRTVGRAFVPVQVSLSVVLVALAALLSQSLLHIRGEDTGFEVDHVTIQTPPFRQLPQTGNAKLELYQRMVDRIQQAAGVQSAAVTWYTPMTGSQANAAFQTSSDSAVVTTAYNQVGPGYFRTMDISLSAGREFARGERDRSVCVLNQSAARQLFHGQTAIDRYMRSADTQRFPSPVTCRVIGVAEDAKFASLREPPPPTVYFPATADIADTNLVFLIHAVSKTEAIAAYRDALREIAPSIPLVLFATLREQMDAALGSQRALTLLTNFFGAVALFLSAIGLYGMLSSSVAQRTAEIGVRMALGARRGTVIRMVLRDALRLLGIGVLLGSAGLFFAVRYVRHFLYGVSTFDPAVLLATAGLLTAVGLMAALIPALRAASVDPVDALRAG